MKLINKLFLVLGLAAALSVARAGTITFEDMPDAYLFYGGQTNFGNYWAGINFGPSSTILDSVRGGYNSSGYPPHSGTSVLFSISTPYIDATLDNAIDNFSFWYSAPQPFAVETYDALDNLLTSTPLASVYGSNQFISVSSPSENIKRIRFIGTGNYFTIDDFTAPFVSGKPRTDTVPDAGSSLILVSLAFACIAASRRRLLNQA